MFNPSDRVDETFASADGRVGATPTARPPPLPGEHEPVFYGAFFPYEGTVHALVVGRLHKMSLGRNIHGSSCHWDYRCGSNYYYKRKN